jgi:Ca2+-binding EF-hand superfamily protein
MAVKPDTPIPGLTEEQSEFFRYVDANGDGQISREEYRNVIVRFFERMDRRHHGYVTDKEIRKAFPAVRQGQPIARPHPVPSDLTRRIVPKQIEG